MKQIANRLKNWENGNKLGPFSIQLNPTNRCNLKCKFCWQRTNEEINYEEVNDQRYLDLIEEAKALDVRELEITGGGEPLVRKDLTMNLIEKGKEKPFKVKLITNGTLLNRENIEKMVKLKLNEIILSLDGKKETHESLRQKEGCYDSTVNSIKNLSSLKSKLGSNYPKATIHMVLCKENIEEVREMVILTDELGCENFFLEPVVILAFDTDLGKELAIEGSDIEKAIKEAKKAAREADKRGINHNLNSLKEELINKTNKMDEVIEKDYKKKQSGANGKIKDAACYKPWHNLVIRPEGTVGPCCMFDNKGPNIKESSLEKIWFGDYFKNMREKMLNNNLPSFCSKCNPSQVSSNREIREELQTG